ncbi:MAG TPA: MmcQ/YjbR family DNA-binding protein, partial [Actinophytocola sp.]|uniref:MmcQ/YjbR family DNA-binding protein n=1 Tax=Actinophytocola sp. TaxID=1872138 RepID=UPI002DFCE79F|nr:MmcQ/YjbR family DNA-binding protein [Actinophytocola sp.]
ADCAEELPGAQLEHPFGPDWEVFKVRGKVFMLMTEVPGRPVVCCAPLMLRMAASFTVRPVRVWEGPAGLSGGAWCGRC